MKCESCPLGLAIATFEVKTGEIQNISYIYMYTDKILIICPYNHITLHSAEAVVVEDARTSRSTS